MTQYLIFRGPRFFLSECKSLSAAWTVTLLFEDLETKIIVMNDLQMGPAKWVQAGINSPVLCQTSALFQERAQLFQVVWLKVALCKSERMQKRTVLVPYKQFRLFDPEISGITTFPTGWHQNLKCLAGLQKKIVATLQKHLLRCSDTAYMYANGAALCSTLSCDRDCRDTYRSLGEEWSVGKQ